MKTKQEPGSVYLLTLRQNEILKRKYETGVYAITVLLCVVFLLAAMLYFCYTRPAHAGGFAEIGKSNFTRPAEFIWWQGPYPHEFQTDSGYFRIGYEGKPQKVLWGSVAGRVSGFDLGHYKTIGLATSDEALLANGRCNVSTCAPPDYYETRGSVRGLLFSGVYRKGPIFFEGGASITRQKYWLFVNVLDDRSGNGPAGRFYNWADTHTAVGYMASVGAEFKNFHFAFAYWLNGKASEFYAASNTPGIDTVKTFSVGWRF